MNNNFIALKDLGAKGTYEDMYIRSGLIRELSKTGTGTTVRYGGSYEQFHTPLPVEQVVEIINKFEEEGKSVE